MGIWVLGKESNVLKRGSEQWAEFERQESLAIPSTNDLTQSDINSKTLLSTSKVTQKTQTQQWAIQTSSDLTR